MKTSRTFLQRLLGHQHGQALPAVMLGMLGLMGMAGLTVDVGRAYAVRSQLQSSANAAVLTAADKIYQSDPDASKVVSLAITTAELYGGASADPQNKITQGVNYNPFSGTVTTTATVPCLDTLMPNAEKCVRTGSNPTPGNAVKVVQTAKLNTFFMSIAGVPTLTVSATATAAIQGAAQPWNIAIILDATPSMGNIDPYCAQANTTSEQCALNGIQGMLEKIVPCNDGTTTCQANSSTANLRVSLFSFPNVLAGTGSGTVADDYNCSGKPTAMAYTLPVNPTTDSPLSTASYAPIEYSSVLGSKNPVTLTYQITPPGIGNADKNGFLSDFYDPSQANSLNTNSILIQAVGNGVKNGCLKPPNFTGGSGSETSFAGAIYAAQTALQAENAYAKTLGINAKNAIIFVSDGQANAPYSRFPQSVSNVLSGKGIPVTSSGSKTTNLTGAANSFGTYPDFNNNCQQAMQAAIDAANAGTTVFAVAYGSETSGCTSSTSGTDSTVTIKNASTLNYPITSVNKIVPCATMQNIASSMSNFYADGLSATNGCTAAGTTATDLTSAFSAIAASFVPSHLVSNSAQ